MLAFRRFVAVCAVFAEVTVLAAPSHGVSAGHDHDYRLEKPTVDPPVTNLDEYLFPQLMYMKSYIEPWSEPSGAAKQINEACKHVFANEGYDLKGVEMFNVTYEDCEAPWVMCRHKDAYFLQNMTAEYFARIPVGMRQYIRHVVLLPFGSHGSSAAYNSNDNIIIKGKPTLTDIIAAVARSLAIYGFETEGLYWETQEWQDAYAMDSAVLNPVSQLSQEENLKQMTVIALYDAQKPGFVRNRIPEWEKIRNQYEQIEKDVKPGIFTVTTETRCSERLEDSPVVDVEVST